VIKPHGSDALNPLFIADDAQRAALIEEAATLEQVLVSSAAAANAVMLGGGYFNPLNGYMTKADALSVAKSMTTESGLFFPVPVLNLLDEADFAIGDRLALRDPNVEGNPVVAIQTVSSIEQFSTQDLQEIAQAVYGTTDEAHPGVAAFLSQGSYAVAGDIQVLNFSYFETDFADTFRTAVQIRQDIANSGWNKVVAFQTRNPMHRAHEELCKMAMEAVEADGCVIHMLLGKLKAGDIPADVRDASIREMVANYFPENSVMVTGYGFDMLYAEIEIFRADHTAYSKKLNKVVMMRDVPDHEFEDFVILSGTKVRELLGNGIAPPPEFSRPEVAKILMDYYQSL